jgi:hypothetical protein
MQEHHVDLDDPGMLVEPPPERSIRVSVRGIREVISRPLMGITGPSISSAADDQALF